MESIGAGLGDIIDLRPSLAPVLSLKGILYDRGLLDFICAEQISGYPSVIQVGVRIHIVDSIHGE